MFAHNFLLPVLSHLEVTSPSWLRLSERVLRVPLVFSIDTHHPSSSNRDLARNGLAFFIYLSKI